MHRNAMAVFPLLKCTQSPPFSSFGTDHSLCLEHSIHSLHHIKSNPPLDLNSKGPCPEQPVLSNPPTAHLDEIPQLRRFWSLPVLSPQSTSQLVK